EARTVASETEQPTLEAAALLGQGQIARQRGQSTAAATLLEDAAQRLERAKRPAVAAQAVVESARLALTRGELDRARALSARTRALTEEATRQTDEPDPLAAALLVEEDLALALGQLEGARARAEEASGAAERERDGLSAIRAALGRAEVELRAENLDAAVQAFNRALDLARAGEATVEGALASLGLAGVLLRRGLYEEAAIGHQEQLARLRVADDVAVLAQAHEGIGEARRELGDLPAARQAFAEAQQLYRESDNLLGQATAKEHD